MAKKNYDELVKKILTNIGGRDNISFCTHCVTRLRFNVKIKDMVNEEEIQSLSGVLGVQWSGEQLQIIIGPEVKNVYSAVCKEAGFEEEESIDENLDKPKEKFKITKIFEAIANCVIPMMPAMIASGMTRLICTLLTMWGLMDAEGSTYLILNTLADAVFYFAPVFVGANAAKQFEIPQTMGMLMGAVLVHPNLVTALSSGNAVSIFGLPVYAISYTSTIFPVILCVLVMAQIWKLLGRFIPSVVSTLLQPLLTMLIMLPIGLCALAPLGAFIGTYLSSAIIWLYENTGFVGIAILSAVYPFLVMTGMHMGLVTYAFTAFMSVGYDPICYAANIMANLTQGAAALAVSLKTKDKSLKSNGIAGGVTALIGGIMEPPLYGVNMKLKKPLYCAMIGAACGGAIAGLGQVKAYIMGQTSLLGIANYVGVSTANVVWMVVAMVVALVVTFVMTYLMYKEEK